MRWTRSVGPVMILAGGLAGVIARELPAQVREVKVADYAAEDVAGIFGELDPPRTFVQGVRKLVKVVGGQQRAYEIVSVLNAENTFNGWVAESSNTPNWKVRGNWSALDGGKLIAAVSKGKACTHVWKTEIVTTNAENGADDKFEVYVDLTAKPRAAEAASFEAGEVTEIAMPLADFKLQRLNPDTLEFETVRPNLSAVTKVTIVFEEKVLERNQQPKTSVLHIHSVRVSK